MNHDDGQTWHGQTRVSAPPVPLPLALALSLSLSLSLYIYIYICIYIYIYICIYIVLRQLPPGTRVPLSAVLLFFFITVKPRLEGYAIRCRANTAHIRQSRPDAGLGFQVKPLTVFPSSLGSGHQSLPHEAINANRFISKLLDYADKHAKSVC